MCSFSSERTSKLQLDTEQPSTGECWMPPKKRYSTSKSKGGAPADDKKGKIMFRSNPIPARDAQRAQTKFFVHQDPETPQRLSQKCL